VGGDAELLAEVAGIFLEECQTLLAATQAAVARGDGQALERAAHTLKGSVGHFCAHAAADAALRLEQIGREGDLTQAAGALAALEEALDRLAPALRKLLASGP
jgi:HPt (histidine-containing phosphotransfer) domain-containing protein